MSFLPWLPRISEELDLQKPELLASSSGQPRAALYRLYISSSPLGVADSLQPHAVLTFHSLSLLTASHIGSHHCQKLSQELESPCLQCSPLYPAITVSSHQWACSPAHHYLDANWNSTASAAGEPSYPHTEYFKMSQFSGTDVPHSSHSYYCCLDALFFTYLFYLVYTLHFINIFHIKNIVGNEGFQQSRKSVAAKTTIKKKKRGQTV